MTCIISYVDKAGNIMLAGDKLGSDYFTGAIIKEPKVFKKKDFYIGYTSSFRMGQILKHLWQIPPKKENQTLENYLYLDIIESIRNCFKTFGFGKDEKYGTFILIYKNRIFTVQDDLSLIENNQPIVSVGSGKYHAEAAIKAILKYEKNNKKICSIVFQIVSDSVNSVSEEFDLIEIKKADSKNE